MARRSLWLRRFGFLVLAFGVAVRAPAEGLREELLQTLEKTPHPKSEADFQPAPHLACLNQGRTLVCWSFATCSFVESEMIRLKLPPARLSVMYPVYCQYLEKTRRFVHTKGASRFNPGDLFTGVPEACQRYGALPASVYDRQPADRGLDQRRLYSELEDLMQGVKREGRWDEDRVLGQAKAILNLHLGEPPKTFSFEDKSYTPQSFAAQVVKLPWTDYLLLTSFESAPFYTFTDLKVPDNWQHNSNYFNLPLPAFYEAFKGALRTGFTLAVSIDTSEPSYDTTGRYCFIPDFDLPAAAITQAARELRFLNGGTTDDHAVHIIGYRDLSGEDWFLAQDSWKTAWRDGNQGCLFLHGSYAKLKVLAFIVHRDGVPAALLKP